MTTPHGYESYCWSHIPGYWENDDKDNVHVFVPDSTGDVPEIMFACHLDTVGTVPKRVRVHRSRKGKITTDKSTILGADCKIGAALMIQMIEARLPGWYVFHAGEERGCIGSKWLARRSKDWPFIPRYCISFDRRGKDSIVTHQMGRRTASDEFANALAMELYKPGWIKMEPDAGGVYTDSNEYADIIPECTNISVGYYNQHTTNEMQDIRWANHLLEKLLKVDWLNLPVCRDPKDDYYSRRWGQYYPDMTDDDDPHDYGDMEDEDSNPIPEAPLEAVCVECGHLSFIPGDMINEMHFCEECGTPIEPYENDFPSDNRETLYDSDIP